MVEKSQKKSKNCKYLISRRIHKKLAELMACVAGDLVSEGQEWKGNFSLNSLLYLLNFGPCEWIVQSIKCDSSCPKSSPIPPRPHSVCEAPSCRLFSPPAAAPYYQVPNTAHPTALQAGLCSSCAQECGHPRHGLWRPPHLTLNLCSGPLAEGTMRNLLIAFAWFSCLQSAGVNSRLGSLSRLRRCMWSASYIVDAQ